MFKKNVRDRIFNILKYECDKQCSQVKTEITFIISNHFGRYDYLYVYFLDIFFIRKL